MIVRLSTIASFKTSAKNNFQSGRVTPASEQAASAPCVLWALAVQAFFGYHVLGLVYPESPFSFLNRPVCLSRPIPSHHYPPAYLFVFGVRRTPTKLSALGAALATPPLLVAGIRPLASQNTSFVVCTPPPFYRHVYYSMNNSLVVTIR